MNPHTGAKGSGTRPEGRAPVAVALKSPLGKKKLISAVTLFFLSPT